MVHEDNGFKPKPFKVNIPDEEIARTRELLQIHRLPNNPVFHGVTSDAGTEYNFKLSALQIGAKVFASPGTGGCMKLNSAS